MSLRMNLFSFALVLLFATALGQEETELRSLFRKPPRIYSTSPLWVWNDMLTEQQIRGTLRDLSSQNVKQAFVHPRPGLMTPYLSKRWFELYKAALEEAERLDMNIWIYDENSYPSGFAGGWVPELMPESRGRGLGFRVVKKPAEAGRDWLAVYRMDGGTYRNVSEEVRSGASLPEGRYVVAYMRRARSSPWFGGKFYVDLLFPGVTKKFLEVTHEAYKRYLGEQFGKRIPGSFTDEPQLRPAGGLPWTLDLPEVFRKRWGYDLISHLPALRYAVGDWKKIRHNYFQVLMELFIERWAKPYYRYCEKNSLFFTGHYWEHEWPNCIAVPDNMAMYAWQQIPGIDCLMNQYREDVHSQFGNVRAVRELASVANQLGRKRTLCEAYGAGGWDLRFEDMKRIGDWLYALGVNFLDQHLSFITIRGARKRDHPQSFSYHEPWWEAYHVLATYFTRLSAALSQGKQENRILVIEPTTTAWMYQGDRNRLESLGNDFQKLLLALEALQIEYDIGDEYIISNWGSVVGSKVRVGQASYDLVVLPRGFENLNLPTFKLLRKFLHAGGRILCEGKAPERIDGRETEKTEVLAKNKNWKFLTREDLLEECLKFQKSQGFFIERSKTERGILFHLRKRLPEGQFLFLVNTSLKEEAKGEVFVKGAKSVEKWDPRTARILPYPSDSQGEFCRIPFSLPHAGSLLLYLKPEGKPLKKAPPEEPALKLSSKPEVERLNPNVLVLDYVDLKVAGEEHKGIYFFEASQLVFRKHGLAGNPWERAVQFKDEIIKKTFPPESGFEATYRFTIEGKVPSDLKVVIESAQLYTIFCNGSKVKPIKGSWWLDRSFGVIPVSKFARLGENTVTIKAKPLTIYHELEPAYVIGSFSLRKSSSGFVIVPEKELGLGAWNKQGLCLYGHAVKYTETLRIPSFKRCVLRLGRWYGSVAKVSVNKKMAGYIGWAPWKLDITPFVKEGLNEVSVTVIGTLKNTLGPHHGKPPLGSAWPGMFTRAPRKGPPPGSSYHTVQYGLFEPFFVEVYQ